MSDAKVIHVLQELLLRQSHVSIVQVGSHVGNSENDPIHRFLWSVKGGECTAILIEPVKHLFEQLVKNYGRCPADVRFENAAVAEEAGYRDFWRLREDADLTGMPDWLNQLGSLLQDRIDTMWDACEQNPAHKKFLAENTVMDRVRCATIEELRKKHGIGEIDFLQLDAEGYDYDILKAIDFTSIKPKAINYERVLLGPLEDECRQMLRSHGYVLYDHDHNIDTICVLGELGIGGRWKQRRHLTRDQRRYRRRP